MPGIELPDGQILTRCEVVTLRLLLDGLTARQTADRLFISKRTVEFHARNIYRKLGVNRLLLAAHRLEELGILPHVLDEAGAPPGRSR